MRFTNGIIIFFVIATVDEVLSKLFDHADKEGTDTKGCNIVYQNHTMSENICSDKFDSVQIANFINDPLMKVELIKISKTDARRIKAGTFPASNTLRQLYLPENNISIIDDDAFDFMSALTHLYLNNNKLKSFNAYIITAGFNIKYLDLGYNSFEGMMDTALYNLKSLTYLNLDGNKFKNISMGKLINNVESVKEVSMAKNLLTRITNEFFDPLINLEVLNLAFNKISYIGGAFLFMENLKTLILSHNYLTRFDKFDIPLKRPSLLKNLAIDYNQLMFLSWEVLDAMPLLSKIAIYGNQWYCICIYDHRRDFANRFIKPIKEVCNVRGGNGEYCVDADTESCTRYDSALAASALNYDRDHPLVYIPNITYNCVLDEF
ncbi:leucine-rich repeat transmembrane neuronal protein 3-like [Diabrotica virgifera virgifera]|uniref:Leucine-rich repeat transmembrane neuronal protein 3-like n=1 Tax=Diabrotica virgifera virgifera TaxID=50390 RepID=A0A6P7GL59_DIAVI|nr:leucine-rich repeat transmembrane neuronal protein 3-like [Diabrotica virgifera virgifera]